MEVEVKNPLNKVMHNGDAPVVTTIQAPQTLPSRILYSGYDARMQYEQLEKDIYDGIKKAKKRDYHKFPTVLKILLGVGALASCVIFRKNIVSSVKNFFKTLFK